MALFCYWLTSARQCLVSSSNPMKTSTLSGFARMLCVLAFAGLIPAFTSVAKAQVLASVAFYNDPNDSGVKHDIFSITVDYSKSIGEMIAAGEYDVVVPTNASFELKTNGGKEVTLTAKLIHFVNAASSADAIALMKKDGGRPATIEELLACGAQWRILQQRYKIAALGSVALADGNPVVPCLSGDDRRRIFVMVPFNTVWKGGNGGIRFLEIRTGK